MEDAMKNIKDMTSQVFRANAPELDPLRIGTGWKPEDLGKIQVFIESTFGDSHPGSGHLNKLVEASRRSPRGGRIRRTLFYDRYVRRREPG